VPRAAIALHGGERRVSPVADADPGHRLYLPADPAGRASATPDKIAWLERVDREAAAHRSARRARHPASVGRGARKWCSSPPADGELAADVRPLVRFQTSRCWWKQGGRPRTGLRPAPAARYSARRARRGRAAARLWARRSGAPGRSSISTRGPAPAGTMTVVLGPGWPGILLHEGDRARASKEDFNRKGHLRIRRPHRRAGGGRRSAP